MTGGSEPLDPQAILQAWEIEQPVALTRVEHGTNNLTWEVRTSTGSYILRVYQNVQNLVHVAYEHALLRALRSASLSFSVPTPMASRTGPDLVSVHSNGSESVASLVPLIPGHHPSADHYQDVVLSGSALGELDEGLRRVELREDPPQVTRPWEAALHPFSGHQEIRRVHALVPDPFEAISSLGLDLTQCTALLEIVADLEADIADLYSSLPRQIIHGDMSRSSVNQGRSCDGSSRL